MNQHWREVGRVQRAREVLAGKHGAHTTLVWELATDVVEMAAELSGQKDWLEEAGGLLQKKAKHIQELEAQLAKVASLEGLVALDTLKEITTALDQSDSDLWFYTADKHVASNIVRAWIKELMEGKDLRCEQCGHLANLHYTDDPGRTCSVYPDGSNRCTCSGFKQLVPR